MQGVCADDYPLNATGRKQAAKAGQRLSKEPFVAAYSSNFNRARETAEIILEHNGAFKGPIKVEDKKFSVRLVTVLNGCVSFNSNGPY